MASSSTASMSHRGPLVELFTETSATQMGAVQEATVAAEATAAAAAATETPLTEQAIGNPVKAEEGTTSRHGSGAGSRKGTRAASLSPSRLRIASSAESTPIRGNTAKPKASPKKPTETETQPQAEPPSSQRSKRSLETTQGYENVPIFDPVAAGSKLAELEQRVSVVEGLSERLTNLETNIEKLREESSGVKGEQFNMLQLLNDMAKQMDETNDKIHNFSEYHTELSIKLAEIASAIGEARPERHSIASPIPVPPGISEPRHGAQHNAPLGGSNTGAQAHTGTGEEDGSSQPNLHFDSRMPRATTNQQGGSEMMSSYGVGKSIQEKITYVISPKYGRELTEFNGSIEEFESWSRRMISHMSQSTQRYRVLMENVAKNNGPILKNDLMNTVIDGYNGWEIAVTVEAFTVKFLGRDLQDDVLQLCGNEELNGLELWRNLFVLFNGNDATIIKTGGMQKFMQFPRCEDERKLLHHLTEWQGLLTKYAGHLRNDAATLRALILGIVPAAMEDKLTPKVDKYKTWQDIHQYVKGKLEHKRLHQIARVIHSAKPASTKKHVFAFTNGPDDEEPEQPESQQSFKIPTMDDLDKMRKDIVDQIHAVGGSQRGPKGPRKDTKSEGQKKKKKFFFRGCWQCGSLKHSRYECPEWKGVLDKYGKPPAGHMGAKDKALAKWKEERKAKQSQKRHVKALGVDDDDDTEDYTDSEDEDTSRMFSFNHRINALGVRSPSMSSTESCHPRSRSRSREPEAANHQALFDSLDFEGRKHAFVSREWDNVKKRFTKLTDAEARDYCSKMKAAVTLDHYRTMNQRGEFPPLSYKTVMSLMNSHTMGQTCERLWGAQSHSVKDAKDFWDKHDLNDILEKDSSPSEFTDVKHGTPYKQAIISNSSQSSQANHNCFSALEADADDDHEEISQDNTDFLNKFAHRIWKGKKLSQAEKKRSNLRRNKVMITKEEDLNLPETRELINALPKSPESIAKLAKYAETIDEKLAPGEILCMADTGSTVHAIDVSKECPQLKHLVRALPKKKKGRSAETACGGHVEIDGELEITGLIDNELHTIPFYDMKVSMPIASMRRTVKAGNDLCIQPEGGWIKNRKTGKVIKLIERHGVYFFKLQLLPPSQQKQQTDQGFGRPA